MDWQLCPKGHSPKPLQILRWPIVLQGANLLLQVPHLFASKTCISHWNPSEFLGKGSLSSTPLWELRRSPYLYPGGVHHACITMRIYLCSTHQTKAMCRTALVCGAALHSAMQRTSFCFGVREWFHATASRKQRKLLSQTFPAETAKSKTSSLIQKDLFSWLEPFQLWLPEDVNYLFVCLADRSLKHECTGDYNKQKSDFFPPS